MSEEAAVAQPEFKNHGWRVTFAIAYYGASALLITAALTTLFVKPPHHTIAAAEA